MATTTNELNCWFTKFTALVNILTGRGLITGTKKGVIIRQEFLRGDIIGTRDLFTKYPTQSSQIQSWISRIAKEVSLLSLPKDKVCIGLTTRITTPQDWNNAYIQLRRDLPLALAASDINPSLTQSVLNSLDVLMIPVLKIIK